MGAAGDRHLAEFVPWYLSSEKEIHRRGVVLTPSSFRLATYANRQNKKSILKNFKVNDEKFVTRNFCVRMVNAYFDNLCPGRDPVVIETERR